MRTFYLFFALILIGFTSCDMSVSKHLPADQVRELERGALGNEIEKLIYDYRTTHDTCLLNEAMILVDSGYTYYSKFSDSGFRNFVIQKASIYSYKKQFDKGVEYIESIPDSIFNKNYKKHFVINELQALKCDIEGDTLTRNKHIKDIIANMKLYYEDIDDANFNDLFTLVDYYGIRAMMENKDFLIKEVNRKNDKRLDNQSKEMIINSIEFYSNFSNEISK